MTTVPLDTIATVVGTVAPLFAALWAFNQSINRRFDQLRVEMGSQGSQLRAELDSQSSQLRAEMRGQGSELRTEMGDMRSELRAEFAAVRAEIRHVDDRVFQLARDMAPTRQE
ncbi:MAG: hypothetical protein QM572_04720 [Nocardioides sp.]|uniref:hypothetical protein n=1 Tax=Nocardioides sp. TaxID=35761 RepID=UPI0039E3F966